MIKVLLIPILLISVLANNYDRELAVNNTKKAAAEILRELLKKDGEEYFCLTKQMIELINELETVK